MELIKRIEYLEKAQRFAWNKEVIITESCQWVVPLTTYYEIFMISGGSGGTVTRVTPYDAHGGRSGMYKEIIKQYNKGDSVDITIGAGGKGNNDYKNGIDPYPSGGDTIFDGIYCNQLKIGVYSQNEFVPSGIDIEDVNHSKIRSAGSGFGGGFDNSNIELCHGRWYGAGGGALGGNWNGTIITNAGDGGQGMVRIRWNDLSNL